MFSVGASDYCPLHSQGGLIYPRPCVWKSRRDSPLQNGCCLRKVIQQLLTSLHLLQSSSKKEGRGGDSLIVRHWGRCREERRGTAGGHRSLGSRAGWNEASIPKADALKHRESFAMAETTPECILMPGKQAERTTAST